MGDGIARLTFNPYTTHIPIPVKNRLINVLFLLWVLQIRFDDESAKVDARLHSDNGACWHLAPYPQIAEFGITIVIVRLTAGVVSI